MSTKRPCPNRIHLVKNDTRGTADSGKSKNPARLLEEKEEQEARA